MIIHHSSATTVTFLLCLFHISIAAKFDVYNPPTSTENTILRFQKQLLGIVNHPEASIRRSDVKARVNSWLHSLDSDSRKRYSSWMDEFNGIENVQSDKIKNVLLQLSTESQRAFSRILMIQQNERFSREERQERLKHVYESMKQQVRDEIINTFNPSSSVHPTRANRNS